LASDRSRQGRDLSELAVALLQNELAGSAVEFIVLGGLTPDTLVTPSSDTPVHLGTRDADLLIDFHLGTSPNVGELELALLRLEFSPSDENGWRWTGRVNGLPVVIEFLCDLDDHPEGAAQLPGCEHLMAANLRGTGIVAKDWDWHTVTTQLATGEEISVQVRYAGLCGYLFAKARALKERSLEKDCYDFVYVLLYNSLGGPREAARAVKQGPLCDEISTLATVWREISARYVSESDPAVRAFVNQSIQADPALDKARLAQDAISAVQEFLSELGVQI
jgi:hypothetical protein